MSRDENVLVINDDETEGCDYVKRKAYIKKALGINRITLLKHWESGILAVPVLSIETVRKGDPDSLYSTE